MRVFSPAVGLLSRLRFAHKFALIGLVDPAAIDAAIESAAALHAALGPALDGLIETRLGREERGSTVRPAEWSPNTAQAY